MTLFKICGLRDSSSAILARESGASFLGFVFVHGVRRQISLSAAIEILNYFRFLFVAMISQLQTGVVEINGDKL